MSKFAEKDQLNSNKETLDEKHHEVAPNHNVETEEDRIARISAGATLQNALHGISKPQLFAEADEFCRVNGLEEHQEVFRKGALLAQKPNEWDSIAELSPEDRANVEYEHRHN